ncbi:MAG TPA: FmdB family zinc ribbon protein [Candidatus Polarisedimenticolia bacterium]|nr:FmdB family zinc ribbon protein [Candidatus Polarisedimenticolia bacterium]
MPLFEYLCRACSKQFETLLIGSERPVCTGCGSADLERLVSTFAVGGGAGRSAFDPMSAAEAGACGTCGDPRGPGSCSRN